MSVLTLLNLQKFLKCKMENIVIAVLGVHVRETVWWNVSNKEGKGDSLSRGEHRGQ